MFDRKTDSYNCFVIQHGFGKLNIWYMIKSIVMPPISVCLCSVTFRKSSLNPLERKRGQPLTSDFFKGEGAVFWQTAIYRQKVFRSGSRLLGKILAHCWTETERKGSESKEFLSLEIPSVNFSNSAYCYNFVVVTKMFRLFTFIPMTSTCMFRFHCFKNEEV